MAFKSPTVPESKLAEFMQTARERFRAGLDADAKDREDAKDDVRFVSGGLNQWEEAAVKQRSDPSYPRPIVTWNRTHVFVQQVCNDGRQSSPGIAVSASDSGKPETANAIQSWMRQIEYDSQSDIASDTAREQQVISARAWTRLRTDYVGDSLKQIPIIEPIENQFSVVWDPSAKRYDKSDGEWLFVVSYTSEDKYKAKYGTDTDLARSEFAQRSDLGDWVGVGLGGKNLQVAEYFLKRHKNRVKVQLEDGSESWKDELEPGFEPFITSERDIDTVTVTQYVIDGVGILKETQWLTDDIPLIPTWGRQEVVDGVLRNVSLVRNAKDPQRLLNLFISNMAEQVGQMPKSPWIMEEGQAGNHEAEWETANIVPRSFLQYKGTAVGGSPAPPPQRITSEPPIQALTIGINLCVDAIKASMGIFDASLGAQARETSGIAITKRSREADNANFHFRSNEGRSRAALGRQLLKLLEKLYPNGIKVTVRGVDGKTKELWINQPATDEATGETYHHELNSNHYSVSISTAPSYKSQMEQGAAQWGQILQSNPNLPFYDIALRAMNVPGAEEAAARYAKTLPPQLQPADEKQPAIPPQVQQAMEMGKQQMTQMTEIIHKLNDERDRNLLEIESRERLAKMNDDTRRYEIEMRTRVDQMRLGQASAALQLETEIDANKHAHELDQREADRSHEKELEAMRNESAQRQAQMAAQQQPEPEPAGVGEANG